MSTVVSSSVFRTICGAAGCACTASVGEPEGLIDVPMKRIRPPIAAERTLVNETLSIDTSVQNPSLAAASLVVDGQNNNGAADHLVCPVENIEGNRHSNLP